MKTISKTIAALLLLIMPLSSAFAQRSVNDGGNTNTNTNTNSDSDPYKGSSAFWTVNVDNLKADGTGSNKTTGIIISKKGSYAYLVICNYPNTLQTTGLIMDVYMKKGKEYKFVETKEYTLSEGLKTTYIKYSFYKKGDYKFAVYNANSKWINTAYLEVSYK